MSIDEIYDLFMWDASYTDEEYAEREKKGIEEAGKLKNLYPFIQPIVVPPGKSKSVWESCAKVLVLRSDEELKPFLCLLFEWLQDMNWPGADIIFNRLTQMPFPEIESEFLFSRGWADKTQDEMWRMNLDEFEKRTMISDIGQ